MRLPRICVTAAAKGDACKEILLFDGGSVNAALAEAVVGLPLTHIRFVDADDGSFAGLVAQERAKIHHRRRLAERVDA